METYKKRLIVKNVQEVEIVESHLERTKAIFAGGGDNMEISDGYHTMDELYTHRITLYIALCRSVKNEKRVWRSKTHSDGSQMEGWFILGINQKAGEQITYHLPNKLWDETAFAETRERAPEWDKHTPEDVLKRIEEL